MIRNYIKISIRNFLKHKNYSIINIAGLTIGLAACLIIFQFIAFEYSFDNFHKNKEKLFRIAIAISRTGDEGTSAFTGYGMAPALIDAIPEIEYAARLHPEYSGAIVSNPDDPEKVFEEDEVFYADGAFLKMFSYGIIKGDKNSLDNGKEMYLSETAAKKYFGNENPIGKVLNVTGEVESKYKVAGIFKDIPENSHLQFNMLLPMRELLNGEDYRNEPEGGWSWNNFLTYVQLNSRSDLKAVEKKMTEVFMTYRGEKLKEQGIRGAVKVQPLLDIHLNDEIEGPKVIMGSYRTVYFFGTIGIITLLIALINYINLTTARSFDRSKEVGVRKVIGAQKKQLILQFLSETALSNFVAVVFAVIAVEIFLPIINNLAGTKLNWDLFANPVLWWGFTIIFIVCTLLAGLYPAFLLSSFKPVQALKGKFGAFKGQIWLRSGLVILQFSASVILIGGTAIVYNQLSYMRQIDLGLEMDKVITIKGPEVLPEGIEHENAVGTFINEVKRLPEIKESATSSSLPGQGFNWNGASIRKSSDDPTNTLRGVVTYIDSSFLKLYGLELIAGKGFSDISLPLADEAVWPVIANETAVKNLGYKDPHDAINKTIDIGGYTASIAGVLKDFNWSSAHVARQNIFFGPIIAGMNVSLKIDTENLAGTIENIKRIYEELFPGNVFRYDFVEERFDEQYKNDERFANLFTLFAGIAILIACLGLFGLAVFTTKQRTKEIGVRKVLGATVPEIVLLLSKDFIILIVAAISIAIPIVYLLMNNWLEEFAYKISVKPTVFILTGMITLFIAIITVSYQTIRAALSNPVNSLKHE